MISEFEETRYDIPSLEPFGHRGFIAEFGGSRVPNQLMVKFISKKYENIKVMHINGSIPSDNEYIFYVLDEN